MGAVKCAGAAGEPGGAAVPSLLAAGHPWLPTGHPGQASNPALEDAALHQVRIWAVKYHFHLPSDLQPAHLLAQTKPPGASKPSLALADPLPGKSYLGEALLPGTAAPAIKLSLNFKGILKCVFMAPLLSLYNLR